MSRSQLLTGGTFLSLVIVVAIALTFSGRNDPAGAHAPHGTLNFSIGVDVNGDGTNDCGTGVPAAVGNGAPDPVPAEVTNTTCTAAAGAALLARGYLISTGGIAYGAASIHVEYSGVTPTRHGESVWDGCTYAVFASGPGFENSGCTIGPAIGARTNLGVISVFAFNCSASGTLALGADMGETGLTDDALEEHREGGVDALTVQCGSEPVTPATATSTVTALPAATSTAVTSPTATNTQAATPTPTITAVMPTATKTVGTPATATSTAVGPVTGTSTAGMTPTATSTAVGPQTPTHTPGPAATGTPIPAFTPTRSPTATLTAEPQPTVIGGVTGDSNCNGLVDSVDAYLILHFDVGLVEGVPCPVLADVDADSRVGVRDAALVLQYDAGVIDKLG